MKISTTSMFNIHQGSSESLKDYLARFDEATTRVVPPNIEIFVGVLQNGLEAGHFNESVA